MPKQAKGEVRFSGETWRALLTRQAVRVQIANALTEGEGENG